MALEPVPFRSPATNHHLPPFAARVKRHASPLQPRGWPIKSVSPSGERAREPALLNKLCSGSG